MLDVNRANVPRSQPRESVMGRKPALDDAEADDAAQTELDLDEAEDEGDENDFGLDDNPGC